MKKELAENNSIYIGDYLDIMESICRGFTRSDVAKLLKKIGSNSIDSSERFISVLKLEYFNFINNIRTGFTIPKIKQMSPEELKEEIDLYRSKKFDIRLLFGKLGRSKVENFIAEYSLSKKVELDDQMRDALLETKNNISYRKCPFDELFIPLNINMDNIETFGIIVSDSYVYKKESEALKITVLGYDHGDDSIFYTQRFIFEDGLDNGKVYGKGILSSGQRGEHRLEIKIATFIVNLLDSMNHPDVEVRNVRWHNNKKRIQRGQLPVNDRLYITIGGKLKRAMNSYQGDKLHYVGRFWVRGHFIHFWNRKKYKRLYSMDEETLKQSEYYIDNQGTISKWILPYVKGSGELRKRKYKLKGGNKNE